MSVQDFWELLLISYSTNTWVKWVILKILTAKMTFCCAHQSAKNEGDQKFSLKAVSFLVSHASFWNHSCGKTFCKIDFGSCFAKSLQSIVIIHCWLFDSILWSWPLKKLGVFWKTDPRWLPFFHFYLFKVLLRTSCKHSDQSNHQFLRQLTFFVKSHHPHKGLLGRNLNIH